MVLIIHQPDRHGIIIIIQSSEKHSTRKIQRAKIFNLTCVKTIKSCESLKLDSNNVLNVVSVKIDQSYPVIYGHK